MWNSEGKWTDFIYIDSAASDKVELLFDSREFVFVCSQFFHNPYSSLHLCLGNIHFDTMAPSFIERQEVASSITLETLSSDRNHINDRDFPSSLATSKPSTMEKLVASGGGANTLNEGEVVEDESIYMSGVKLGLVMSGLCLCSFLVGLVYGPLSFP